MIVVIQDHNARQYSDLLAQMFRLRARIFRDKLNWDVRVEDGMERDKYDDEGPVYVISTDSACRTVIGSLRLMPTTGPTLLNEVFADTVPDAAFLSAPSIWECTRFCVDEQSFSVAAFEKAAYASRLLFAALGEVAIEAGIETVLGNFDATMHRLYRRIGVDVDVIGHTKRYGRKVFLGSFPVTEDILTRVKAGLRNPVDELARADVGRSLAA